MFSVTLYFWPTLNVKWTQLRRSCCRVFHYLDDNFLLLRAADARSRRVSRRSPVEDLVSLLDLDLLHHRDLSLALGEFIGAAAAAASSHDDQ